MLASGIAKVGRTEARAPATRDSAPSVHLCQLSVLIVTVVNRESDAKKLTKIIQHSVAI